MCIESLEKFLRFKKIKSKDFAKYLGVKEVQLKQYITGETYPPKLVMEKLVVLSEGKVQPTDFLFQYKSDFNIIEYIKDNLSRAIINRKELAFILGKTSSNISRRLNGKIKFQEGELIKIMKYIEHKILSKKIKNNI